MISLSTSAILHEVVIPGAAQSTLQDFRLPESAGGYTYDESNSWLSPTSNRFIVWKTNKDIIEFRELSMDHELENSDLRLRLVNTPILEGVSITETPTLVVILLATVGSVHRLNFPSPKKLHSMFSQVKRTPSIFYNFNPANITNPNNYFVWNNHLTHGNAPSLNFPITSCSWLKDNDALFVLANSTGSLIELKLSSSGEKTIVGELKQSSLIERLRGFVPSIIRSSQDDEGVVSILSHNLNGETLLVALSNDMKLRIWSYQKQKCLVSQTLQSSSQAEMIESCVRRPFLRKCQSGDDLFLSVFICSMDQKQFVMYRLVRDFFPTSSTNSSATLKQVATINMPLEDDLVDFRVVGREIWCLCLDSQMRTTLRHASFECTGAWQTCLLNSDIAPITTPTHLWTPKNYIKQIFNPGKFSTQTIGKALAAFSRNTTDDLTTVTTHTELMDKVLKEIEKSAMTGTSKDHEARLLENESWEKFYSYCVQYHNVSTKPLAILLDPKTGLVSLTTKSIVSFVPRHDLMNQVIISLEKDLTTIADDPQVTSSLQVLLDSVSLVSRNLPDEAIQLFEHALGEGNTVFDVAQKILDRFLLSAEVDNSDEKLEPLKLKFGHLHTRAPLLIEAIDVVVKSLNLDVCDLLDISEMEAPSHYLEHLFSSSVGSSLVAQNLKVFARIRLNFCRDLLLFQMFLINLRNTIGFTSKQDEKLRSINVQTTLHYVHAYYFITWVSDARLDPKIGQHGATQELIEAQLNVLGLHEYIGINRQSEKSNLESDLLQVFIAKKGGPLAKKLLSDKLISFDGSVMNQVWSEVLPQYTMCVAQLLWPMSGYLHLPELLLGLNQLRLLDEYVRLCDPWVQNLCSTREFLTGYIKLNRGKSPQSISHFNIAAFGAGQEIFLRKLSQVTSESIEDHDVTTICFNYYVKVIQLISNQSDPHSVIEIANQAILQLDQGDENYSEHLSQLYTTLFLNYLEIEKYDEAYNVMILNPDSNQRNDRLRQLIVRLYEKNCTKKLVSFAYDGFSEDFVQIIETKARSNDLSSSPGSVYYEILFSYHSKEGRHRRAASTMYEYGRRLSQEVPGIESLKKQVHCYLMTLNCLRLVDKKFQWIVKPSLRHKNSSVTDTCPSPKRPFDSDSMVKVAKREIQVLGINEIKIEYELASCRLKLLEKDPRLNDLAGSSLGSNEVITLLLSNSMYDSVFKLSQILGLSKVPIFESLICKYIRLVQLPAHELNPDDSLNEIYDCFADDLISSQNFALLNDTPLASKIWHLIQAYLELYEEPKSSKLHKCVVEKLLSAGITIPTSLKQSYQLRNCPQLFWLLMSYNYIEEASILALEYMDGILGRGTEFFDIREPLGPTSPAVYIPHNHLQNLLTLLTDPKHDEYSQYQRKVFDKIQELQDTTYRYSNALLRAEGLEE